MNDKWPKLVIVGSEECGPQYFHIANLDELHKLALTIVDNNVQGGFYDFEEITTFEDYLSDNFRVPLDVATGLSQSYSFRILNLKKDYQFEFDCFQLFEKAEKACEENNGMLALEVLIDFNKISQGRNAEYQFTIEDYATCE